MYPESEDNCSESDKLSQPPVYALPNKLKEKRSLELSEEGVMESDQFESSCPPTEKSCDLEDLQNEEVSYIMWSIHIYMATLTYACPTLDQRNILFYTPVHI